MNLLERFFCKNKERTNDSEPVENISQEEFFCACAKYLTESETRTIYQSIFCRERSVWYIKKYILIYRKKYAIPKYNVTLEVDSFLKSVKNMSPTHITQRVNNKFQLDCPEFVIKCFLERIKRNDTAIISTPVISNWSADKDEVLIQMVSTTCSISDELTNSFNIQTNSAFSRNQLYERYRTLRKKYGSKIPSLIGRPARISSEVYARREFLYKNFNGKTIRQMACAAKVHAKSVRTDLCKLPQMGYNLPANWIQVIKKVSLDDTIQIQNGLLIVNNDKCPPELELLWQLMLCRDDWNTSEFREAYVKLCASYDYRPDICNLRAQISKVCEKHYGFFALVSQYVGFIQLKGEKR